LNDPNLDPFERELLEEDLDHLTSELARHGRRAEAWESKSTTISAEISVRRARMPATGKSEAETTYNSVEELEPSPEISDHGPGPSTLELNSTADLSDQIDGIGSSELSTVRPCQIDAAAKAARQVICHRRHSRPRVDRGSRSAHRTNEPRELTLPMQP